MNYQDENSFTYSYGWLGYFMKYFGGIVLFILVLLFLAILVLIFYGGYFTEKPIHYSLLTGVSLVMGVLCSIGGYYCIRYANYFTCDFIFTNEGLSIEKNGSTKSEYTWSELQSVTFRKFPKLLILDFGSNYSKIVLMNNSSSEETESYNDLKEYLFDKPVTQNVVWL